MNFWVRNATNRDVPAIVEVVKSVFDEYEFSWEPDGYHHDLYDIEDHYWRHGHAFWVAETLEDDKIVGTCGLYMFPPVPIGGGQVHEFEGFQRVSGADCALERLYVHANGRKGGVGTTLLEHAFTHAIDKGRKRMEIWSDKKLEDAHRLYQKFGAKVVGERICHDPDQSPEWGLMLPLRGGIEIEF